MRWRSLNHLSSVHLFFFLKWSCVVSFVRQIICFKCLRKNERKKKNLVFCCSDPAVVGGRCLTSCLSGFNSGEKCSFNSIFVFPVQETTVDVFWFTSLTGCWDSLSREPRDVCQTSRHECKVCQRASWATLSSDTHTALMSSRHLKLCNVQQQQSSVLLTVRLSVLL